ncbi:hypothetical protein [Nonomuraea basaltis]|uniref:hypothetical protein n=1 Tax=Nonomuraea basaltis TaxID=2495887 RepID=UPI00110C6F7E|nr:hypothetical protein [Nonomuraea basaltis]TMR91555.1 hypothetical protein EJK15_49250 [Nonomuraea basaltis]
MRRLAEITTVLTAVMLMLFGILAIANASTDTTAAPTATHRFCVTKTGTDLTCYRSAAAKEQARAAADVSEIQFKKTNSNNYFSVWSWNGCGQSIALATWDNDTADRGIMLAGGPCASWDGYNWENCMLGFLGKGGPGEWVNLEDNKLSCVQFR